MNPDQWVACVKTEIGIVSVISVIAFLRKVRHLFR